MYGESAKQLRPANAEHDSSHDYLMVLRLSKCLHS